MTLAIARGQLAAELERMGAGYVVLSTNVELRLDGQPYSNRTPPADPGAAVYFSRDRGKSQLCIACDRYDRVADNVRALAKTVEALRGLERWGTKEIVDAAFSGFKALPERGTGTAWWTVLGIADPARATIADVELAYRAAARSAHPDAAGGSHERMVAVNEALQQARAAVASRASR